MEARIEAIPPSLMNAAGGPVPTASQSRPPFRLVGRNPGLTDRLPETCPGLIVTARDLCGDGHVVRDSEMRWHDYGPMLMNMTLRPK